MDELRRTADTRPGYATYPNTRPGSPNWWRRHGQQPPARPAPAARPWTGPEPLMSVGPPMILAAVDEQDDEQEQAADQFGDEFAPFLAAQLQDPEVRAAYEAEATKPAPPTPTGFITLVEPEPRRWWHRITRGMT